jgi:hypothetical protein
MVMVAVAAVVCTILNVTRIIFPLLLLIQIHCVLRYEIYLFICAVSIIGLLAVDAACKELN